MLSIVPTPIGNLKDITLRALEVLKTADGVICEDTRHTGRLLKHFEIERAMISFHDHSPASRREELLVRLEKGEHLALVSDAGMPLVSDPGFDLVNEAIRRGLPVQVLPGAQAAVTALVASGLAVDAFVFLGFLPQKGGKRRTELERVAAYEETLIFYESPYRTGAALADMLEVFGDREAAVARELTKKFEEVTRGTLKELAAAFQDRKVLGEIVIVVAGHDRKKLFSGRESQ